MSKNKMFNFFPMNWISASILNLPAHHSLNYFWNFGSLLGMILVVQFISGLLLSLNYVSSSAIAFTSVMMISQEAFNGVLLRWLHLNGGSLFFLIAYLHMSRGLYNHSFRMEKAWFSGVTILLLLMGVAFLGYVLPWGQMSLWGATVITNLISAVPVFGTKLVFWVWGGFSVNSATLTFFYSLHFLLPFIIFIFVLFHLIFLHETGSSSSIFLYTHESKLKFNFSYSIKDLMNVMVFFFLFLFCFIAPYKLGDPENFIFANPMMSPLHIQPEWYFLFAYAILRSIPNKLGGVLALVASVVVFYVFPFFQNIFPLLKNWFKIIFWFFLVVFILLTWLGGNPVEPPYIVLGQVLSFFYFFLVVLYLLPKNFYV